MISAQWWSSRQLSLVGLALEKDSGASGVGFGFLSLCLHRLSLLFKDFLRLGEGVFGYI
jgi:hypothetical protein